MDRVSLSARIDALERQNRFLRRCGIGGLIVVGAMALMAQAPIGPSEIRASRFVIVDANGVSLGTLQVDAGRAGLELRDHAGTVVRLGSTGTRGAVQYRDANGLLKDLTQPDHGVKLIR